MCQNGIFYETSITDALIYAYQTNDTSNFYFFLTGILYIYIYIERERERQWSEREIVDGNQQSVEQLERMLKQCEYEGMRAKSGQRRYGGKCLFQHHRDHCKWSAREISSPLPFYIEVYTIIFSCQLQ